PATIEQVVRGKAQAVPARRVCRGVVVAESRHLGVLETWPTDLPGGVIDDASGPPIRADIRDVASFLFRQRPARQDAIQSGRLNPLLLIELLIETAQDFRLR